MTVHLLFQQIVLLPNVALSQNIITLICPIKSAYTSFRLPGIVLTIAIDCLQRRDIDHIIASPLFMYI